MQKSEVVSSQISSGYGTDGVIDLEVEDDESEDLGASTSDSEENRTIDELDIALLEEPHIGVSWGAQKEEDMLDFIQKSFVRQPSKFKEKDDVLVNRCRLQKDGDDPDTWRVKCLVGTEQATLLMLMRKSITDWECNLPVHIRSIVLPKGEKGALYIEVHHEDALRAAIQNVPSLFLDEYKFVPTYEMHRALSVNKRAIRLKVNSFVRIKRGLYKHDLARVVEIHVAQNMVTLALWPRRLEGDAGATSPAPFDPIRVIANGGRVKYDADWIFFNGEKYNHRGFLHKTFHCSMLVEELAPDASEVKKFENEDLVVRVETLNREYVNRKRECEMSTFPSTSGSVLLSSPATDGEHSISMFSSSFGNVRNGLLEKHVDVELLSLCSKVAGEPNSAKKRRKYKARTCAHLHTSTPIRTKPPMNFEDMIDLTGDDPGIYSIFRND